MNTAASQALENIQFINRPLDLLCPICEDSSLEVGQLFETQVCGCQNCRGFLIDGPSLGSLIVQLRSQYLGPDDSPTPLDQSQLNQVIKCPACFDSMYTHPYHGPGNVILNSCSKCQMNWFDHGEFAKVIRAPGQRNR